MKRRRNVYDLPGIIHCISISVEAGMFVQISTDNQIKSDAESNARLEERVRAKLKRFEQRLTHVEVHVEDVNGHKGGDADKRVSLEARPTGHEPIAVHAEATRVESAVSLAADKAVRALAHALDKRGH
jgi:ribosome-associated translation inhibitor RaiA